MVFCRMDPLTSRNTANVMIIRTVITRKSQPVIRNVMDFLNFLFKLLPSLRYSAHKSGALSAVHPSRRTYPAPRTVWMSFFCPFPSIFFLR